ncbi:hypothetical protein [Eisenibacter elegans]|uniref:hypothetical protein n=1 Tax=Eisenibacter elegans TaxID=997 RepID=UPI000426ABB2|nr:hypothetical protein [Eisenibacter elegans]
MKTLAYRGFAGLPAPRLHQTPPTTRPSLPEKWVCTALLHPFSPPLVEGAIEDTPFFQLCIANIAFIKEQILSIQLTGLEYGTWWYKVYQDRTLLSRDQGMSWQEIHLEWTLPSTEWLEPSAQYFQTGYLNWMEEPLVDWWKQPSGDAEAATWIWFEHTTQLPFRMMFGNPPPSPQTGDPRQLPLFQNFSFTYFANFAAAENPTLDHWLPAAIEGLVVGNPNEYKLPQWQECFAMTTLMTPVDVRSMPLPTLVLYQWKPNLIYEIYTDRAQHTVMSYEYNPQAGFGTQVAALYGITPPDASHIPDLAGEGFIFNLDTVDDEVPTRCWSLGLGLQPPHWPSIPAVRGKIHLTLFNTPKFCPKHTVMVFSALFPPTKEYPQGRYLWAWYSPFPNSDGTHSRPITFMESASNIAQGGTSLALADYFSYEEYPEKTWFPPAHFTLPPYCLTHPSPSPARAHGGH